MPYKNAKKQKSYMRVYMRDRQREEKVRREVEDKQAKWRVIESFLPDKAEGTDPHELLVQPEVQKPSVQEGDVKVKSVTEGVPPHLKDMVKRVQQTCLVDRNVVVSEIWVKRQFELYERTDFSELIAMSNLYRHMHLGRKIESMKEMVKAGHMKASDALASRELKEAKAIGQEDKDAQEAMQQFIVGSILQGKNTAEIVSAARSYEGTQKYFRHRTEGMARVLIDEIKGILNPSEDAPPLKDGEVDFALKTLKTKADIELLTSAKRLVDAKKKGVEKKKKPTYHVTVDE